MRNDFIIPEKELGFGKKHLEIRYSLGKELYQIRDLCDGTGTFIKIERPLPLKDRNVISFVDIHFLVKISEIKGYTEKMVSEKKRFGKIG